MNRVLQIFKKDMAHLWPQILVFLAALVLFACEDPTYTFHSSGELRDLVNFLFILLPLSCWLLVTSVIQEEKPIGDEQYWLTRPFSLAHLLGAKILFLLLCVIASVFLCQAIVLSVVPQSPGLDIGALVAKDAFLFTWYVLPAAAVAAVTKNLGHALLGGLLMLMVIGTFMTMSSRSGWNGLAWIHETLAAIAALCGSIAVIVLQYTQRRTIVGRGCLAAAMVLVAVVLALPPFQAAFVVQSWFSKERVNPSAMRIALDSRHDPEDNQIYAGGPTVYLRIPVELQNVPANRGVVADWIYVESPWRSRWSGKVGLWRGRFLGLQVQAPEFLRLKDEPIRVKGAVDLTLVAPGCSQCREEALDDVYCIWNPQVFSPFPTSPWFGPLDRYKRAKPEHPVAHIQRPFDLGPLRLADYVVIK
jgi:hypothetical protein